MKNFLFSTLSSNGKISSKRLVTLGAFIAVLVAFFCNLFAKLTIDEKILECMEWIVLGGLGFTASERFSSKSSSEKETDTQA